MGTTDNGLDERAANVLRTLVRDEEDEKYFKKVDLGRYILSIQASTTHYCSPRETFPTPEAYDAFEVAIFDRGDDWVNPKVDDQLKNFQWAAEFESSDTPVRGYVPREEVHQIIRDILSVSKKSLN